MTNRHDGSDGTIDRRTFLGEGARYGTAVAGLALVPGWSSETLAAGAETKQDPAPPDISVVRGTHLFESTRTAIEQLGGAERFVGPGDRVGLLINSYADKPGTFTHPEIVLAVGQLCYWAGARSVVCLRDEDEDYWELYPDQKKHAAMIARFPAADSDHREIEVRGAVLKEASILEAALDCERLINLAILKHHSGCRMTGCLKNMMGLSSVGTNLGFHLGPSPVSTFISNIGEMFPLPDHFAQSLADLNKVRRPDLCLLDATELITTNGPTGPGKIVRPGEVIAGTDPVAMDALGCAHLGLEPKDVLILEKAHASGVGELDPTRLRVARTELA
jgi:uncharacterized protein (DUF362 family)